MSVQRLFALCATLPLIFACDAQVTTSPDLPVNIAYGASQGPSIASGSGHVPSGSGMRVFTFHSIEKPDGSVSGSYTIRLTSPGLFFSVDVSCMAIEGNTAWVAGLISETNASFIQVGSVSYFYAVDNGEGAEASTDVVSSARINDVAGEDQLFCSDRPLLLPSFPIEQGNVQVR